MPYKKISELPKQTQILPTHAKKIWMGAFNSAYEKYKDDERSAKIAWGAVKKSYKKVGERWIRKAQTKTTVYTDRFEYKSENGKYFVEGYLEVADKTPDLVGDIVTDRCLESMLRQIPVGLEGNVILGGGLMANKGIEHEHVFNDRRIIPITKIVDRAVKSIDGDKYLWIKTQLNHHLPEFPAVWGSIQDGFINAFSMEFLPKDWTVEGGNRILSDVYLGGYSMTGKPIKQSCSFTDFYVKSVQEVDKMEEENKTEETPQEGTEETEETEKTEENVEKKTEETEDTEVKALREKLKKLEKDLEEVKARKFDEKLLEEVKSTILEEVKNLKPESKALVEKETKFEKKALSKDEVAQKILGIN